MFNEQFYDNTSGVKILKQKCNGYFYFGYTPLNNHFDKNIFNLFTKDLIGMACKAQYENTNR